MYSPTSWSRVISSGLRSSGTNGPTSEARGPARIRERASRCSVGEIGLGQGRQPVVGHPCDPRAALRSGMTFWAISSIDRFASDGSTQSRPA